MEIIKVKPKIPKIDVPDPLWNWCNEEEQEFIFKHIPDKNKPIFLFMILHGTRPGEARAIHREDLDLKIGTCLIRRSFANDIYRTTTKTRKQRLIPLHPDIIPVLKNIPVVKGFLFLDPKTNEPYKKCRLWRIFNRARKKAGIEDITLYQWSKHSFCSQAVNRGISHKLIGEMVGTLSESALRRYQHANLAGLKLTLRPSAKILDMKKGKK